MMPAQEPTLDELLAAPIVRMLMARDGVTADEVRRLLRQAQEGNRPRPDGTRPAAEARGSRGRERRRPAAPSARQTPIGPARATSCLHAFMG